MERAPSGKSAAMEFLRRRAGLDKTREFVLRSHQSETSNMLRCQLCCDASLGPLGTTFLGRDRPHKKDVFAPIRSRLFPRAICFDLLQCWKKMALSREGGHTDRLVRAGVAWPSVFCRSQLLN